MLIVMLVIFSWLFIGYWSGASGISSLLFQHPRYGYPKEYKRVAILATLMGPLGCIGTIWEFGSKSFIKPFWPWLFTKTSAINPLNPL